MAWMEVTAGSAVWRRSIRAPTHTGAVYQAHAKSGKVIRQPTGGIRVAMQQGQQV